jgi:hypothetical protein
MTAGLSINLVCVKVRSVAANISVCVAIVRRRFYHKLSPREFHHELLVLLLSILPDRLILVAGRQEAGLVVAFTLLAFKITLFLWRGFGFRAYLTIISGRVPYYVQWREISTLRDDGDTGVTITKHRSNVQESLLASGVSRILVYKNSFVRRVVCEVRGHVNHLDHAPGNR